MKSLQNKTTKAPTLRNIVRNNYKCQSQAIEKHILGALVKCREILYNPNIKPIKMMQLQKRKK